MDDTSPSPSAASSSPSSPTPSSASAASPSRAARATRHDLLEAERWIRSDDRSWPCSFVNVCEALDIAHEPLRRAVLKWRTTPMRKRVTRRGLLVRRKLKVVEPSQVTGPSQVAEPS